MDHGERRNSLAQRLGFGTVIVVACLVIVSVLWPRLRRKYDFYGPAFWQEQGVLKRTEGLSIELLYVPKDASRKEAGLVLVLHNWTNEAIDLNAAIPQAKRFYIAVELLDSNVLTKSPDGGRLARNYEEANMAGMKCLVSSRPTVPPKGTVQIDLSFDELVSPPHGGKGAVRQIVPADCWLQLKKGVEVSLYEGADGSTQRYLETGYCLHKLALACFDITEVKPDRECRLKPHGGYVGAQDTMARPEALKGLGERDGRKGTFYFSVDMTCASV